MSSVQDTVKCPQCGGCYTTDFDCRTLEEFKFCERCGKKEFVTLVLDEKHISENKNTGMSVMLIPIFVIYRKRPPII